MKKIFFLIFVIIFFVVWYSYNSFLDSPINQNRGSVEFSVKQGESVEKIINNLSRAGLVKNKYFLKFYLRANKLSKKIKAGNFEFKKNISVKELINKLINGEVVDNEFSVQIIEGWSIEDIDNYLSGFPTFKKGDFSKLAEKQISNWTYNFEKPDIVKKAPSTVNLEGYFFPDTYKIFKNAKVEDVAKKMLETMDDKISDKMRKDILKSGKSVHDILTMASIIEKEVISDKDRAIVSGILNKRISLGMRLEVDSSINYITKKNIPSASLKDLEIDSPYNTYKNYGLPPGPISNPGLSSIMAAIYPAESPYLFYLNRQDTKETIFSKNFSEHIRNKNKYLK